VLGVNYFVSNNAMKHAKLCGYNLWAVIQHVQKSTKENRQILITDYFSMYAFSYELLCCYMFLQSQIKSVAVGSLPPFILPNNFVR